MKQIKKCSKNPINNNNICKKKVKNNKNKKILKSAPPKKKPGGDNNNNDNTTKEEIRTNLKNDVSLLYKYRDTNTNYNISYDEKNEKYSFEEIFDEVNADNTHNHTKEKNDFMKNNYLEYKRQELMKEIKNALSPIDEDDYNFRKKKRKNSLISEPKSIYKNRLKNYYNGANIYQNLKIHKNKTFPFYEYNSNKTDTSKKMANFLFDEESGFEGDARFYSPGNKRKNKGQENLLLLNKKKKIVDLISENSDNGSYYGRNHKSRKTDLYFNQKGNNLYKTENKDLFKNRIKLNYDSSLNSEKKRNQKASDINSSRNQLMSKNSILSESSNNGSSNLSLQRSGVFKLNGNENFFVFCIFYWNYFIRREIFFTSLYNKDDNIAVFIRIITFILVMSFIFTINCLLLTTNHIHNRYVYSKTNNEINEAKYVFTQEFSKNLCSALISIIFKMICIKIVYNKYFKISSKDKEELSPFNNRILIETENNMINQRKEQLLKNYRKKSLIYILIVTALMILFGYISICYVGTFQNTKVGILLGFFLSVFLSFLICALFCLIISLIYLIGQKRKIKYFIDAYYFLKKIY